MGLPSNRLTDLLSLSFVPRWSIVRHAPAQTVGDHVYRVMVIYTELCRRLGDPVELNALTWILHHDAPESRTGDIPTPAKDRMKVLADKEWCLWLREWEDDVATVTASLADLIEAYTFIEANGRGDHSKRVAAALFAKLQSNTPPEMWSTVMSVIDDITFESGR